MFRILALDTCRPEVTIGLPISGLSRLGDPEVSAFTFLHRPGVVLIFPFSSAACRVSLGAFIATDVGHEEGQRHLPAIRPVHGPQRSYHKDVSLIG